MVQVQEDPTPEQLISQAIVSNVPVETIERLMKLRDQLKAEKAREAYFEALSEFQAICPPIEKAKEAKDEHGKTMYKYAPIEAIVVQVKEHLKACGFSYCFQTDIKSDQVSITCESRHKLGHIEKSIMQSPLANRTRMMSAPQQIASTVTFLKRYAFCNVFGIVTADEDNDAVEIHTQKSAPSNSPVYVNDFQKKRLTELGVTLGYTAESIKAHLAKSLNLESFDKMPFGLASRTIGSMQKRIAEKRAEEAVAKTTAPSTKTETKEEPSAPKEAEPEKEDDMSFTKVACRKCNKSVELKDAYNEWFCSKECSEAYVKENYGTRFPRKY